MLCFEKFNALNKSYFKQILLIIVITRLFSPVSTLSATSVVGNKQTNKKTKQLGVKEGYSIIVDLKARLGTGIFLHGTLTHPSATLGVLVWGCCSMCVWLERLRRQMVVIDIIGTLS